MRTRIRTIVSASKSRLSTPSSYEYEDCAGTKSRSSSNLPAFDLNSKAKEEEMTDEIGNGKKAHHYVMHRSRSWDFTVCDNLGSYRAQTNVPGIITWDGTPTADWWTRLAYLSCLDSTNNLGYYNISTSPLVPHLPPSRWGIGSLSPINESVLKENCFEKARELKSDVLQDIIEYNQVWPSIRNIALALPLMKARWSTLRRLLKNAAVHTPTTLLREYAPDLADVAGSVSSGYLAYKFGFSPVLQDIVAVNKYLPKAAADLKRHSEGQNLRFSSKAEVSATFDVAPKTVSIYGYPYGVYTLSGKVLEPPTVRYVLIVRPTARFVNPVAKQLDNFVQRFTTSPAKLAWDLIPFSFIADWFVDMRGLLRSLDNAVGITPYEVVGMTRSFTYKLSNSIVYEARKSCAANTLMMKGPIGDVVFTHYERNPISYSPSKVLWNPRFGKNQAAISAALVTQALYRVGRR